MICRSSKGLKGPQESYTFSESFRFLLVRLLSNLAKQSRIPQVFPKSVFLRPGFASVLVQKLVVGFVGCLLVVFFSPKACCGLAAQLRADDDRMG